VAAWAALVAAGAAVLPIGDRPPMGVIDPILTVANGRNREAQKGER